MDGAHGAPTVCAPGNDELAKREHGEWSLRGSRLGSRDALGNALGKAKEQKLFLGVTWEWLQQDPETK